MQGGRGVSGSVDGWRRERNDNDDHSTILLLYRHDNNDGWQWKSLGRGEAKIKGEDRILTAVRGG